MSHPPRSALGTQPAGSPPGRPAHTPSQQLAAAPAAIPGTLSSALLEATTAQRNVLLSHRWTTEAFAGQNGNPGAIRIWAQQEQHFCGYEQQALKRLLGYRPPALLRSVIVDLIKDTDRDGEPEMFAGILSELGADPAPAPALTCEGYGCWLFFQASQGLLPGAAAILAAETAYGQMFEAIEATCPPTSPWRPRVANWAGARFAELVRDLRAGVDELAGRTPVTDLATQLVPVATRGLQWEKAFHDMCIFGQVWPA